MILVPFIKFWRHTSLSKDTHNKVLFISDVLLSALGDVISIFLKRETCSSTNVLAYFAFSGDWNLRSLNRGLSNVAIAYIGLFSILSKYLYIISFNLTDNM